jgi:Phage integrase family
VAFQIQVPAVVKRVARIDQGVAATDGADKRLFGSDYEDHGLIFCQPNGAYYSPDREGARVKELMRAVGLEGVSLHSLRHSFASELLSKGVPLAVVSERLGDADQNITLSIYSHAMPADTRAAAKVWQDAMADVIESSRKPGVTRMLADVSRTGTDGGLFVANKRGKVAGTTGLEPATSDVTGLGSGVRQLFATDASVCTRSGFHIDRRGAA